MSKFTDVELDVMHILWEHGELKPGEIIEHFPRPVQNSAMRSFLNVLVHKGHVSRRRVGKAFYYKAQTQPEPTLNSLLRRTIDVFFSGSTQALLCRLIRSEKLTEEQLLELKRLAEEGEAMESSNSEEPSKRKGKGKGK
jgi:predicted transcriptional regulator